MSAATSADIATAIQKMPIMRCLSVQVMPSFFFFAIEYSNQMMSIPTANVMAAHLSMALPPAVGGPILGRPEPVRRAECHGRERRHRGFPPRNAHAWSGASNSAEIGRASCRERGEDGVERGQVEAK